MDSPFERPDCYCLGDCACDNCATITDDYTTDCCECILCACAVLMVDTALFMHDRRPVHTVVGAVLDTN